MEKEYDPLTVLFCLCDEQSNITYCLLVQRTNKQEVNRQGGGVQLQCFVTDTAALGHFMLRILWYKQWAIVYSFLDNAQQWKTFQRPKFC